MARMTYLEIVRDIMLDVTNGGVWVRTIDESIESTQITEIVKETFYRIIDSREWPHLYSLFQLTETSASTPTHFTVPSNAVRIEYIKYDKRLSTDTRNKYLEVIYKTPLDFMNLLNARVSDASNVTIITDTSGLPLNIYNDKAPTYYTSFDNESVVMDAFDNTVETYLKTAKNQCYSKMYPTVTRTDTAVFDLPNEAFTYLLSEAKATASLSMKGIANLKAEQHSQSQKRRLSWEANNFKTNNSYYDAGRKSRKPL